jgi:hypothetical protein
MVKRSAAALSCFGFLAVCLVGCGPGRQALVEYRNSTETYKACVSAKGPTACETERLLMETDERKFNNIGAAVSGNSTANNVNIQRR